MFGMEPLHVIDFVGSLIVIPLHKEESKFLIIN